MRDLDLAVTGDWIDRPYATAVNTFDFALVQFPDPAAMIANLHGLGFRTALWYTPYLDEADASTAALRAEATTKGYYPPAAGGGFLICRHAMVGGQSSGAIIWPGGPISRTPAAPSS